jgi:hypothetical protein
MAEHTDARRRDVVAAGPCRQHVVNRQLQVAGPFDEVAPREAVGAVMPVVAGMSDGDCDEPGLGQRQRSVVTGLGPAAGPVRDHDQRQLRPGNRRIRCDGLLKQP